uniref:Niemann-Pick C1 protein n=1 Tax=Melanaphis sacchari TaxID=742174 RepID=A0A2H8TMY4_9HEMI
MSPIIITTVAVLFALSSVIPSTRANDTCIWYGECEENYGLHYNCPYNGPPKPMTDPKSIEVLKTWCPDFIQDHSKDGQTLNTCCGVDQLLTLSTNIVQAANFLHRCPSCMRTFGRFICELVCSPTQSRFMNVTKLTKTGNSIKELDFYISDSYMQGVYDSCKSVTNPATGGLAMDLLCSGALHCSAHKWFRYLGKNPYLSFVINYIPVVKTDNRQHFVGPVIPCNQSVDNKTTACSCMDCDESCPLPDKIQESQKLLNVAGIETVTISSAILFCFLMSTFTGFVCFKDVLMNGRKKKNDKHKYIVAEHIKAKHKNMLETVFYKIGKYSASRSHISFMVSVCLIIILSYGIYCIKITIDPVDLWSSSNSQCWQEREYFNTNFKPFFRTTQVIIAPNGVQDVLYNSSEGTYTFGPVFNRTFLLEVLKLQKQIEGLQSSPNNGLEKVCFAPLVSKFNGPPKVSDCVVQSVWGYFSNKPYHINRTNNDGYFDTLKICFQNPYNPSCLAPYGGPVDPSIALGGFSNSSDPITKLSPYEKATSLILTFVLNNHNSKSMLKDALEWEKKFLEFMKNWTRVKPSIMDVAYYSERSVEDELDRESHSDVSTIAMSYVVMFLYIVFTLGWNKIILSFFGIVFVVLSVVFSVGFYGLIGVPLSLIVLEVIPFIVLAVGVDNIFLIIRTYQHTDLKEDELIPDYIGRVLSKIGPSIFITTLAEITCFFIGSLSDMPVVRSFALYAAMALVFNFLLQMSCFIGLLALDAKLKTVKQEIQKQSLVFIIFQKFYVPTLMNKCVRPMIVLLFSAWLCTSIVVITKIDVGLDVELTMTDDSYVLKYFKFMKRYLSTGPPVYFVVTDGLNLTDVNNQNLLCGGIHCDPYSVTNQIYRASKMANLTYINRPSTSWIDDYFDWANLSSCCKVTQNNSFCPHNSVDTLDCDTCNITKNDLDRPNVQHFSKFLPYFLQDSPDKDCSKAGHAAYSDAISLKNNSTGPNYFMTFHTVLKTSKDYYESMRSARSIANNMTNTIKKKNPNTTTTVFPYSVFYVFYEQYLTIWQVCVQHLVLSLVMVTFVTWTFTNFKKSSAFILLIINTMITVDLLAFMYYFDISLNAISLVNIVMSIGIMVEFCGHIIFHNAKSVISCPIQRATHSCVEVGSSVFSGITLTKFAGLAVLGFANTPVFKIFYYKMYMGIVIIAALHSLVFLPVLLSYKGTHYVLEEKTDSSKKKTRSYKLQLLKVNRECALMKE